MEPAYLLGTGGAIGAVLRYGASQWITYDRVPLATLTVNILGSFALAFLTFSTQSDQLLLFFGTGLCGSFTTYSSFSVGTVRLWETGEPLRAVAYAAGTLCLCLLGATLGAASGTGI